MWKFGTAAALATSTVLSSGAARGQETLVIDIMDGGTVFSGSASYYEYAVVQVTVTDPSNVTANSTQNLLSPGGYNDGHFGIQYNLFSAQADVSALTFSSSGLTGALSFAQDYTSSSEAVLTDPAITAGQYQLIVSLDHYDGYTFHEITALLTGMNLGWGVSEIEELASVLAASGSATRLVVVGADGVVRNMGATSLATRDATGGFVRGIDGTVTLSTQGAPGLTDGLYTWVEATSFRSTEDGGGAAKVGGSGFQIGADIAIGADMVAGVSLGFSEINAQDGAFSQEGEFIFLQPYLSYRAGNWQGSASLIYGQGSYDQTSTGGDGTADVTLAAITFEGGYDFALNNQFTVTPTLGLLHGQQEIEGTGGTLTSDETFTFSQASVGARMTFDGPDGQLFAGLHADYLTQDTGVALTDTFMADNGWTGRVEVGGSMALGNGLGLATSVELSGLGGNMETFAGGLRVAFTF